jgi:hypothetical protein
VSPERSEDPERATGPNLSCFVSLELNIALHRRAADLMMSRILLAHEVIRAWMIRFPMAALWWTRRVNKLRERRKVNSELRREKCIVCDRTPAPRAAAAAAELAGRLHRDHVHTGHGALLRPALAGAADAGPAGHPALRPRQGAAQDGHGGLRLHLRHGQRLLHPRHHSLHMCANASPPPLSSAYDPNRLAQDEVRPLPAVEFPALRP